MSSLLWVGCILPSQESETNDDSLSGWWKAEVELEGSSYYSQNFYCFNSNNKFDFLNLEYKGAPGEGELYSINWHNGSFTQNSTSSLTFTLNKKDYIDQKELMNSNWKNSVDFDSPTEGLDPIVLDYALQNNELTLISGGNEFVHTRGGIPSEIKDICE